MRNSENSNDRSVLSHVSIKTNLSFNNDLINEALLMMLQSQSAPTSRRLLQNAGKNESYLQMAKFVLMHALQLINKKPTNWGSRQNVTPLKFYPMPLEAAFSGVPLNFNKCQQEGAGDVISGVAVN